MIAKEYLLARRLANLYWSGFNQKSGYYLLKWSELRSLAEGAVLDNEEIGDVVKFLLSFGYLMAQTEEGVIIWNELEITPRAITENTLHNALQLIAKEDEIEIENELVNSTR